MLYTEVGGDMYRVIRWKKLAIFLCLLMAVLISSGSFVYQTVSAEQNGKKDFIRYVEFNVPYTAMRKALDYDIACHEKGEDQSWIEILAWLGAKYGGDFSRYQSRDMDTLFQMLEKGETMSEIAEGMQYYSYYYEAYSAVLGGMVGEYRVQQTNEAGELEWVERYGLTAFSPIAKTFPYEHYDDFGAQRTYGYTREHLGHDLMAATGTPVIAVESGTVEALGWNQYGGWRIGIRSFDKKRYYYYAHLRQNRPYAQGLQEGQTVTAGDVIGYVGRTGYSTTENVNNIQVSHLHFGMELIFDESQKESDNEIWIDLYDLTTLLNTHQSEVWRDAATKEFYRRYPIEIK